MNTTASVINKMANRLLALQAQVKKLTEQCQTEIGKLQEKQAIQAANDQQLDRKLFQLDQSFRLGALTPVGEQWMGWLNELKDRVTQLEKARDPLTLRPGDPYTTGPGMVPTFGECFEKIYQEVRRIASGELVGPAAADAAMRVMRLLPHPYKRG